jgi:hypothetical protein
MSTKNVGTKDEKDEKILFSVLRSTADRGHKDQSCDHTVNKIARSLDYKDH